MLLKIQFHRGQEYGVHVYIALLFSFYKIPRYYLNRVSFLSIL